MILLANPSGSAALSVQYEVCDTSCSQTTATNGAAISATVDDCPELRG